MSRKLEGILGLTDQTKSTIKGFEGNVNRMGDKMVTIGKRAGVALAALGVAATVVGAKYEQSMANVKAVTNATEAEMEALSASAREMGKTTKFSAGEAGDAFYALGSAGMSAAESIAAIPGVLALAAAEGAGLAEATEAVVASMSMFSLEAEESARVANLFAAGVSAGLQKLPDLQEAMKNTGKAAAQTNIPIETTVALITEFANLGEKGGIAGTHIQQALLKLIKPTGRLADVLGDANLANTEFIDLLGMLEDRGYDAEVAMQDLGARGMGLSTMLQIGTDAINEMTESITGTETAFRKADTMMDTFEGDLLKMKSAAQEVGIAFYESIGPELRQMVQDATEDIARFGEYIVEHKEEIAAAAEATYEALKTSIGWLVDHRGEIEAAILIMFGAATVAKMHSMAVAMKAMAGSGFVKMMTKIPPQAWLVMAAVGATAASIRELNLALEEAEGYTGGWEFGDPGEFVGPQLPEGGIVLDITPEWGPGWEDLVYEQVDAAAAIQIEAAENSLLTQADYLGQRQDLQQQADYLLTAMMEENALADSDAALTRQLESIDNTTAYYQALNVIRQDAQTQALSQTYMFWDSMQAGFATASSLILSTEMTGGKKWLKIKDAILGSALKSVGSFVFSSIKKYWLEAIGKEAVDKVMLVSEVTKQVGQTAAKSTGVAARAALDIPQNVALGVSTGFSTVNMAAEVAAFYAPLGPFGLIPAAGTIASYKTMIAAAAGFAYGTYGTRITDGYGDRKDNVPAMLSRDEYVVPAPAARSIGYSALDAMSRTGSAGGAGGTTVYSPQLTVIAPADAVERMEDVIQDFLESSLGQDFMEDMFRSMVLQGRLGGVF